MPIKGLTDKPKYLTTTSGKKFETYRFYLKSYCNYLQANYSNLPQFISYCLKHTSSIKPLGNIEIDEISRHLRIAWNTEYLLTIDYGLPEITRINNQWTPIQAYYAVYSGLEALSYGINGTHTSSHIKALRKCSNFFINLGISPWDLAFVGNRGKKKNSQEPKNFPEDISLPHNLQRHGIRPIDMIAKCLKVEHSHRVDDKWEGKSKSGYYKYQYDPRPTTLLHFLYRLRIKSNYQEVDTFVAEAPSEIISEFAKSLQTITSWTLSLIEIILIRRFGKENVYDQIKSYLQLNQEAKSLKYRITNYQHLI